MFARLYHMPSYHLADHGPVFVGLSDGAHEDGHVLGDVFAEAALKVPQWTRDKCLAMLLSAIVEEDVTGDMRVAHQFAKEHCYFLDCLADLEIALVHALCARSSVPICALANETFFLHVSPCICQAAASGLTFRTRNTRWPTTWTMRAFGLDACAGGADSRGSIPEWFRLAARAPQREALGRMSRAFRLRVLVALSLCIYSLYQELLTEPDLSSAEGRVFWQWALCTDLRLTMRAASACAAVTQCIHCQSWPALWHPEKHAMTKPCVPLIFASLVIE